MVLQLVFLLFSALALFSPGFAAAEINLPSMPRDYVVDLAGIIDPGARQELNGYLSELEQKTSAQVVVLTVPSLEGKPLEDFSLSVAGKWKLGQKGKDNGVLLLVALKERKYRFEIGYGLEGSLPDSFVGTLGREYLVPNFRRGDYSAGIELAVSAVAQKIAEDAGVRISGLENAPVPAPADESGGTVNLFNLILAGIFFLIVLGLFLRHPGLFLLFLLGGGGRGGFGGGFGGGGFGGGGSFGGGGGGGFGGGGASGGW